MRHHAGFTEASAEHLRALHPTAAGHFPALVDDLVAAALGDAQVREALGSVRTAPERFKAGLTGWLDELLRGPHDDHHFDRRPGIGRELVPAGLPQALVLATFGRLRARLTALIEGDQATSAALHQVLDLEQAIIIEAYREDLETRQRAAERLTAVGQLAAGIGHELRNPLSV